MSVKVFGLIVLNALFLVAGQIFWKLGISAGESGWWRLLLSPLVWLGFGCFGLATAIWFYVLARVPLSQALPVQSIGYIFGVAAGMLFFQETVSAVRWVGAVLILAGICLVARS
jgi:drug/metabolite transporter (DMT)-like permease